MSQQTAPDTDKATRHCGNVLTVAYGGSKSEVRERVLRQHEAGFDVDVEQLIPRIIRGVEEGAKVWAHSNVGHQYIYIWAHNNGSSRKILWLAVVVCGCVRAMSVSLFSCRTSFFLDRKVKQFPAVLSFANVARNSNAIDTLANQRRHRLVDVRLAA